MQLSKIEIVGRAWQAIGSSEEPRSVTQLEQALRRSGAVEALPALRELSHLSNADVAAMLKSAGSAPARTTTRVFAASPAPEGQTARFAGPSTQENYGNYLACSKRVAEAVERGDGPSIHDLKDLWSWAVEAGVDPSPEIFQHLSRSSRYADARLEEARALVEGRFEDAGMRAKPLAILRGTAPEPDDGLSFATKEALLAASITSRVWPALVLKAAVGDLPLSQCRGIDNMNQQVIYRLLERMHSPAPHYPFHEELAEAVAKLAGYATRFFAKSYAQAQQAKSIPALLGELDAAIEARRPREAERLFARFRERAIPTDLDVIDPAWGEVFIARQNAVRQLTGRV